MANTAEVQSQMRGPHIRMQQTWGAQMTQLRLAQLRAVAEICVSACRIVWESGVAITSRRDAT